MSLSWPFLDQGSSRLAGGVSGSSGGPQPTLGPIQPASAVSGPSGVVKLATVKKSSLFDNAVAVDKFNQPARLPDLCLIVKVPTSTSCLGIILLLPVKPCPSFHRTWLLRQCQCLFFRGPLLWLQLPLSQAGVKPSTSALHRPRYQEVAPEYQPEPQFDSISDLEDDYAESSEDSFDSDRTHTLTEIV